MGRVSVLDANQLTAGSLVNSQKSAAYDPFQTVVGTQGNQEQGTMFVFFLNPPSKKTEAS